MQAQAIAATINYSFCRPKDWVNPLDLMLSRARRSAPKKRKQSRKKQATTQVEALRATWRTISLTHNAKLKDTHAD